MLSPAHPSAPTTAVLLRRLIFLPSSIPRCRRPRRGGRFPAQAGGTFWSPLSGDGFSCAVEANASAAVRFWGPRGSAVQAVFADATFVRYLTAGGARTCGVLVSGAMLCSVSDSTAASANVSAALPGELVLSGLAVCDEDSHACGILRPNGPPDNLPAEELGSHAALHLHQPRPRAPQL